MAIEKALAELIEISNKVGSDTQLVQGGGGNTSVKTADGKYMYIKASGTAMKDMDAATGWRRLDISQVLSIIKDDTLTKLDTFTRETEVVNRLALACRDSVKTGARPSVEAHLHAMLDKYVIHLHPVAVGACVSAAGGKTRLERLFAGEKYPPLWVPYYDPGFMLGRKIAALVSEYKKTHGRGPAIIFLEKHGLIVTAANASAGLRLVRKVIKICESNLKRPGRAAPKKNIEAELQKAKSAIRKGLFDATGRYEPVTFFDDEAIKTFAGSGSTKQLLGGRVLTPDELVYSNGCAVWLEKCTADKITAKLKSQIEQGRKTATAFLVKGLGLFVTAGPQVAPVIRDIQAGSLLVRYNAQRTGGINSLTKRQMQFINTWEAEAFRKKLAASDSEGVLKGRIAIVTGAGSGLGKGIATGLARAGAMVAIADVDIKSAQQSAIEIKAELPKVETLVVGCDVTDEQSVQIAYAELLDEWGGLDILVNAAGIAPAYPLVDMPVDKWRLALEVNLTGYFLMAKYAAKIMIKQAMGGSIINLSSKSGLDASMNNTAYNATKAGELHMARGWALELGAAGIRVNSVCPGNVFEGSKIWNPQYIKVCAKKYGIKPEEVIPYYVSKTALKREIKGRDIADAVVFLCSDKARTVTAQTIVADSGQVAVR